MKTLGVPVAHPKGAGQGGHFIGIESDPEEGVDEGSQAFQDVDSEMTEDKR